MKPRTVEAAAEVGRWLRQTGAKAGKGLEAGRGAQAGGRFSRQRLRTCAGGSCRGGSVVCESELVLYGVRSARAIAKKSELQSYYDKVQSSKVTITR